LIFAAAVGTFRLSLVAEDKRVEFAQAIMERRNIRGFKPNLVPKEVAA
jgi:hypothetical protein